MVIMMYNPGKNKTPAIFYDRRETVTQKNKAGEWIQSPRVITKDWVELIPLTGRQYLEYDKAESEMTYRLRMRYREDIHTDDIVTIEDKTYDIIYISPFGRYMEVVIRWQS